MALIGPEVGWGGNGMALMRPEVGWHGDGGGGWLSCDLRHGILSHVKVLRFVAMVGGGGGGGGG